MSKSISLDKIFPLNPLTGHYVTNYAGDVTFCFQIFHPGIFAHDEELYNELHTSLSKLIERSSSEVSFHQQDFYWTDKLEKESVISNYTSRADFRNDFAKPQLRHLSFLYVTFPTLRNNYFATRNDSVLITKPGNLIKGNIFKDIEKKFEKINEEINSIQVTLNGFSEFNIEKLNKDEISEVVFNYLNGSFDEWVSADKSDAAIDPFDIEEKNFKIGNQYIGVMSLADGVSKNYAYDKMSVSSSSQDDNDVAFSTNFNLPTSMAYTIGLGLPIKHVVNTIVEPRNVANVENYFSSKTQEANIISNLAFPAIGMGDEGRRATMKKEIIQDYFQRISDEDQRPCLLKQNVITYSDSLLEHNNNISYVKEAFSNMNGAKCIVENRQTCSLFMSSLVGNSKDNFQYSFGFVRPSSTYFPFETHYLGMSYGFSYQDRFNNNFLFDFTRNAYITAPHKVVFGPTGTGKSFWLNNYFSQAFGLGYHVVILDVGGSYKKLTEVNEGQYIDCGDRKNLSFNIFGDCPKDHKNRLIYNLIDENNDVDKPTEIFAILCKIIPEANKYDVILRKAIIAFYDDINRKIDTNTDADISFTGFAKYLIYYIDNVLEANFRKFIDSDYILLQLQPYINDGEHSYLLNGDVLTSGNSNRFIVYDAKALENNVMIKDIVQLIICSTVTNKLSSVKKSIPKIFCIEEALDFLAQPEMGEFIAGLYRKGRKMGIEMILATQDVNFMNSCPALVRDSIMSNVETKVLLGFNSDESIEGAMRMLSLTEKHIEIIKGLKIKSESFVLVKERVFVLKTVVSPESALIYSTDPKDLDKIEMYQKKYKYVDVAVNQIVAERNGN